MKKELENELEPLDMARPDFWGDVTVILANNPGKVLPVYLKDDKSEQPIGSYFIRLVREKKRLFMQVEGFNSTALEMGFVVGSSNEWKRLQPGIYRLDVTKKTLE